ncbi:hypothetical protein EVAR_19467_1 [Eumeta japonica]|uniref:Uncharacterized protein n=1 Tax=Eumeta variegata TaxID=151549 RepID=A0A4C1VAD2_EUMVA|nr:hypothetical protein EVAR_19467_1 [Eumeta japonica]
MSAAAVMFGRRLSRYSHSLALELAALTPPLNRYERVILFALLKKLKGDHIRSRGRELRKLIKTKTALRKNVLKALAAPSVVSQEKSENKERLEHLKNLTSKRRPQREPAHSSGPL